MASELISYPQTARTCPFSPPDAYSAKELDEPVARVSLWNGSTPWLVTRNADVRRIMRDPRFSKDSKHPGIPSMSAADAAVGSGRNQTFVRMDDPEHARIRGMVQADFKSSKVAELRPAVEEIVHATLRSMTTGKQHADLVDEYALPIPTTVICSILGVPYQDHELFHQLTAAVVGKHADSSEYTAAGVVAAHRELEEYLNELMSQKSGGYQDDLLSRLVDRESAGDLTRDEAVGTAKILLLAGHETTANTMGLSAVLLLEHPDQLDILRQDPSRWPTAIEELLRFTPIIQRGEERVATEDVEVGDVTIRAGEGVICLLSTANRDASIFELPEVLDVQRDARRHLSFGFGMHQCLGQFLAKLELEVALRVLFETLPSLRLTTSLEELKFVDAHAYGLDSVPVEWDEVFSR